jgi:hypothetical protein
MTSKDAAGVTSVEDHHDEATVAASVAPTSFAFHEITCMEGEPTSLRGTRPHSLLQ